MAELIVIGIFCCTVSVTLAFIGLSFDSEFVEDLGKILFLASTVLIFLLQVITYDTHIRKIKEETVIDYVEGAITYDTLSMDKNGKLLTIELIENK
jgi:hypothetical protein